MLLLCAATLAFAADQPVTQQSDQDYINKLYYRHNKLELLTRRRLIDEKRNYNNTDINTSTFYLPSYRDSTTSITSQSYEKAETKVINEWYIYLGGISEISDYEFLKLVGDDREVARIQGIEDQKGKMRFVGNILIGSGLGVMLGGAALGADSKVVTGGALGMVVGFFIDAFNATPAHYISPAYAQQKIDAYNIALKQKLSLPLDYE
jgi:hypothetical protein